MVKQPEAILEEELIAQLQTLAYQYKPIRDDKDLLNNLKTQLEKHNSCSFSDTEFDKILNLLGRGNVFEKAKMLRETQHIESDKGDSIYFRFLNTEHWCQNEYQVSQQISQEGTYKNRYDVTILINGLPLVQIELKRRGLELKEAFNQISRYQKHSYDAGLGLFQFVQIFVISNGINTKYFSNFGTHTPEFLQTFHWTDENNKPFNALESFANTFLETCHLSKIISRYIVLNETEKKLMVLRPYQYYALENIINKVKQNEVLNSYSVKNNGYIWHTTGSGKTLTSFKASQILSKIPAVKKVVFVVDRKDLDYQTNAEYDKFSKGCVSTTENTVDLIKKFNDSSERIIVTTIQKLNNAIAGAKNLEKMKLLQNERMVFIFDECHRSQFGETHKNIVNFFTNIQLFGFTGTPILAENANGEKTTNSLFGACLHKYVITDAIRDENVLRFSVEYIQTFKQKEHIIDLKVEQINEKEVLEAPQRKEAIVDYIIQHHHTKTQNGKFCAMMCVQDIDSVIQYYNLLKAKKQKGEHNLKVITIFSFAQNEDPMDFGIHTELSVVEEPQALYGLTPHRRELLDSYIADFNQMYGTAHSSKDAQGFYNYYTDVSKKAKNDRNKPCCDILLVANMFLTGFDSKFVNTLYVDKNLQYHGLIQAFSRTNRILDKNKTQGNIVCFRNLKEKTDEAITLFSNKDAIDEVIVKPYHEYVKDFNNEVQSLLAIAPEVQAVDDLYTEEEQMKFILAFRALIRLHKKMSHYTEFEWSDLQLEEQAFWDYSSKYQDLKDGINHKETKEKVSILNDIDFELELIRKDNINVGYIVQLLMQLKLNNYNKKDKEATEKQIFNLLNTEATLRSKRELIEKFMQQHLIHINDVENIADEFAQFLDSEKAKAFSQLTKEENLSADRTNQLIKDYLYTKKKPLRDELLGLIDGAKPTLLEREPFSKRLLSRIMDFIDTFINGI